VQRVAALFVLRVVRCGTVVELFAHVLRARLEGAALLGTHLLGEEVQLIEAGAAVFGLGDAIAGDGLEFSGLLMVELEGSLLVGNHDRLAGVQRSRVL